MDRINTATKAVDLFGAGKHGFRNGDLAGGVAPTDLNAEWFNAVQEELLSVIEAAGLAPNGGSLTQVRQAIDVLIRRQAGAVTAAAGTADALTGAFTPAVAAFTDGQRLVVRAAAANATSTPTFKADALAAKTIVRPGGLPLVPGDIAAGSWLQLQYDQTSDKFVLLNPASPATLAQVSATVAANALTVTVQPGAVDFRSSTLTSGAVNTRTLAAAAALVVPAGATLGTVAGQGARLAVLAIDNAGTIEPAIVNLAGGVNLDEGGLISTTAISGAANSASVVYSAVARANVPYRVRGFVDIAEAVAGTWATAPTAVTGAGGNVATSMQSMGYGQTWQNPGGRLAGTVYYNTTGRPIVVNVLVTVNAANAVPSVSINGAVSVSGTSAVSTSHQVAVAAIVPPGASYNVSASGGSVSAVINWSELR